ncbi:MAG: Maf family protein [Candidatus Magasanikiibacteriota bacterium]
MSDPHREGINEIPKKWLEGPVVLASTSNIRREGLKELGFRNDNINQVATNDDDETNALLQYDSTRRCWMLDSHKSQGTIAVAESKVEKALESGVSDDALVVAFDTGTIIFHEQKSPDGYWTGETMQKPKDLDLAKKAMKKIFETLIKHYITSRILFHGLKQSIRTRGDRPSGTMDELMAITDSKMKFADLGTSIMVSTGMATRLPGDKRIVSHSAELQFYPRTLFDLVEKELGGNYDRSTMDNADGIINKLSTKLDILIEQINSLNPELITKVPGGLALHDKRVRVLLDMQAAENMEPIKNDDVDEEALHGMPSKKLKEFLIEQAREKGII